MRRSRRLERKGPSSFVSRPGSLVLCPSSQSPGPLSLVRCPWSFVLLSPSPSRGRCALLRSSRTADRASELWTRDSGQGTLDKGLGTRDAGQETLDKRRGTRDPALLCGVLLAAHSSPARLRPSNRHLRLHPLTRRLTAMDTAHSRALTPECFHVRLTSRRA
jgi:hypothetical protein